MDFCFLKICNKPDYYYKTGMSINWSQESITRIITYVIAKKHYKNCVKLAKKSYLTSQRELIAIASNNYDFWTAIKPFRMQPCSPNILPRSIWIAFYHSLLPTRIYDNTQFTDALHPLLDRDITMEKP